MNNKVLITGATGRNAIQALIASGIAVRAMVHKIDERSESLSRIGAEIVKGDRSTLNLFIMHLMASLLPTFCFPSKPQTF